jgi:vitamin B12 transporter
MNKSLITIGLLLAGLNAVAQTDTLKPVLVEAEKTINPSKTSKTIAFSDDQLLELGQRNLGDLLSKSSAIYIKSYGLGALATPSVRGTGASQTQVFWNGININSPTLGQSDLSILPLIFINKAQLHLGSTSTVDGSGGIGGSIRLDSEANYYKGEQIQFTQELGSFGLKTTGIKIGVGNGKLQSNTTFYSADAVNDYSYQDITLPEKPWVKQTNNAIKQMGLGQDVSYKFDRNEIEFKSIIFNSYRQLPSGYGFQNQSEQTDASQKFLLAYNRLQDKSSHTLKVGLVNDELLYKDPVWMYESKYTTQSLSSIYNGVYYFNNISVKTFLLNQNDVAISDEFDGNKTRNKSAAYVMLEHEVADNLLYHASIRQEYIDEQVAPLAPSLGLKYKLKEEQAISLNAAKTFRAPSLNDLYWSWGGNPDLLPEHAYTTELNYHYIKAKFDVSATVFYSIIDNWIQWAPTEFGFWIPQNIKKVNNTGVELNAKAHVFNTAFSKLDVAVNYTYVKSTTIASAIEDDLSIGNQLIYVPNHVANINVFYSYKKLSFNYLHTFTDKVFTDATNDNSLAAYFPADASVYYTINAISFGCRAQNIFNQQYQVIGGYPMPSRALQFMVRVNFK